MNAKKEGNQNVIEIVELQEKKLFCRNRNSNALKLVFCQTNYHIKIEKGTIYYFEDYRIDPI